MTTLYITHDSFLEHNTGLSHPECADRLRSIERHVEARNFENLTRCEAPKATADQILLVHTAKLYEKLEMLSETSHLREIDGGDTIMSPGSWDAAHHAAGAVSFAVDEVLSGSAHNAFCAVRPPGHHAEPDKAMGFCLFSNAAIGAFYAREKHGIERVAIIDFDVHHGNGTQAAFWDQEHFLYASSHQSPLFPYSGQEDETGLSDNIVNVTLEQGSTIKQFKEVYEAVIVPAIERHEPEIIIISAGFDAHYKDPIGGLRLKEEDFVWVTRKLIDLADKYCSGRVISVLEGGYHLEALGLSTAAHIQTLLEVH